MDIFGVSRFVRNSWQQLQPQINSSLLIGQSKLPRRGKVRIKELVDVWQWKDKTKQKVGVKAETTTDARYQNIQRRKEIQ